MRAVCTWVMIGGVMGAAATAQVATPDLGLVGSLPDSCDLVLATGPLEQLRATPAWWCMKAFTDEIAGWTRTLEAWSRVAEALGMTSDQAADELLRGGVVVAVSGLSDPAPHAAPRRALLCDVRPELEARLRERLRPAPRALEGTAPILSLEHGAFEVATLVRPGQAGASLLIAPRGGDSLFDELLPVMRGASPARPIRDVHQWTHVQSLPLGAVVVLYRDLHPPAPPARGGPVVMPGERFIAASISPREEEVRADVVATRDLLLPKPGTTFGHGLIEPPTTTWPAAAVDWAFNGAMLAVAGNPREVPPDVALGVLGDGRPMLFTLLESLGLPSQVREMMDGVAVVTVHESPDKPGRMITAAIPSREVVRLVKPVDGWATAFAGHRATVDPGTPLASIRVLSIDPAEDDRSGMLRGGGTLAWCYVNPVGGGEGWWVVCVQTERLDEAATARRVRDFAERLDMVSPVPSPTLYQLELRPSRLVKVPSGGLSAGAAEAFRWVDRLRTRLDSAPNGLVRGTFVATFDTTLLGAPRSPPSP